MGKRARALAANAAAGPLPEAADALEPAAVAPSAPALPPALDSDVAAADADGSPEGADAPSARRRKGVAKPLTAEALAAFNAAEKAKGLLYLARVPPFMKPLKLRHLLSRYGDIGRIYLAPEDAAATRRRVASGGNKRVQFVEGWVEFEDKRAARLTAEAIHNTAIGEGARGKARRDFWAADRWNVRYLPHFKWHHLKEKVAFERRARIMALRSKLVEARKGAEAYLARVDQAKGIEGAREKKRRRAAAAGEGGAGATADDAPRRFFPQLPPVEGGGER
jgi:ESF2/ABP1 family protein